MDVNEARRLRALEDENARLKRIVADQSMQIVIQVFTEQGRAGVSSVCRALDLHRSSFYTTIQRSTQSIELAKSILMKIDGNPRFGYRRITTLIRRDGVK